VRYVLEGSVDGYADQVKVRVRLIDVADGSNIWSEKYERSSRDIFALQEGIAGVVATRLSSGLQSTSIAARSSRKAPDPEAYDLYLRALHFQNLSYSAEGAMKSIEFFNRSLERDPDFAPAHAGLAFAYIQLPNVGVISVREAVEKARIEAARALEIDAESADAHATFALALYHDQQFGAADESFRRALAITPNHSNALYWYSLQLTALGQPEPALATMKRALEHDPLSLRVHTGIGLILYYQKRYDEAIIQLTRTLELDTGYPFSHWVLGLTYMQVGDYSKATRHLSQAAELSGGSPLIKATLGSAYARWGRTDAAVAILEEVQSPSSGLYLRPQGLVYLLSDLGRRDEALAVLEASVAERSIHPHVLRTEPLLDPLRGTRRFQALVRKTGMN
jgi:tetratricopeptide (TPR) repeat protein